MVIDHCGITLFAGTSWYLPCRILGRIAFPLYAFLLTEGYVHTHSVKKYAKRLFFFALLSEIPFDYALFGTPCYLGYQNVFFTLLLGLGALISIDRARAGSAVSQIYLVFLMVLSEILCTDYGAFGILLMMVFYIFRDRKAVCTAVAAGLLITYGFASEFPIKGFGAAALIFILFYNGKKGNYPFPSILFYAVYPLHLVVLGLMAR